MSSEGTPRLEGMSTSTKSTITTIGVTMFTVADVDAAIAFYRDTLGFELRADVPFGPGGEMRWVEVAPPGSTARLSLNPPMMGSEPGGGSIGVEATDVRGEYERLKALEDVQIESEPMSGDGVPLLFTLRDPDGNHVTVVEPDPER